MTKEEMPLKNWMSNDENNVIAMLNHLLSLSQCLTTCLEVMNKRRFESKSHGIEYSVLVMYINT